MKIVAISDLDRQDSLKPFESSVSKTEKPDLVLLVGDIAYMMDPNQPRRYKDVLKIFKKYRWNVPVVGIFGNHESGEDDEEKIIKNVKGISFLRDESVVLEVKGKKVGIVGSRGVLDAPMIFETETAVGVLDKYGERIEKIKKMLMGMKVDVKILMTHYAPTYKTLEGEDEDLWNVMGSEVLEQIVEKTKPSFCVHGHAHYGKKMDFIGKTPVFNTVFEVNGGVVEIDTENLPKP